MKIPLNVGQQSGQTSRQQQMKMLERELTAAKKGDWNARSNIYRTFTPLITTLAEKRSSDKTELNSLMEKGKAGLMRAIDKFKLSSGADHFQIFALDFIESGMDSKGGFLAKLFGRT